MNNLVLITWVSWSWKSSLQQELLNRGFVKPANFSTRQARSDEELDDYIFVNKDIFMTKLKNWDFLESTNYWWNFYWIPNILAENFVIGDDICIVVDPVGREQILEKISRLWVNINVMLVYLEINKLVQQTRLWKRGDSKEEMEKRAKDFDWFFPTPSSIILDWTKPIEELATQVELLIFNKN